MTFKKNFPKENIYLETKNGILYNNDVVKQLKQFPNESIDMIITSPPYDNLRTYKQKNIEEIWNFDKFKQVAKELSRIIKNGGIIVWVVNDATIKGSETLTSFKQAIYFKESCGLNVLDTMIWKKPYPFNFGSNNAYIQSFEYMFIICKGKPKTKNFIYDRELKNKGKVIKQMYKNKEGKIIKTNGTYKQGSYGKRHNVWEIKTANKNFGHPAVYPEQLVHDHIITWSNEDEIILDPFMGSGTTAIVAEKTKRKWVGIEINREYCDIAKQRILETVNDDNK